MTEEILSAVDGQLFAVWFRSVRPRCSGCRQDSQWWRLDLLRAKNAGNIPLMKNLMMDFCIGTVVFILIGFWIVTAKMVGLTMPDRQPYHAQVIFDYSLHAPMFCATATTYSRQV